MQPAPSTPGAARQDFAVGGRRSIFRCAHENSQAQSGGTRRNRCNSSPRRNRLLHFVGAARQSGPLVIGFRPASEVAFPCYYFRLPCPATKIPYNPSVLKGTRYCVPSLQRGEALAAK